MKVPILTAQQMQNIASVHGHSLLHIPHLNNTSIEDACNIAVDLGSTIGSLSMRESNQGITLVQPSLMSGTFSSKIGHAPLHTDSSYRTDPEHWILLICVRPAIIGGETILVDTSDLRIKLKQKPDYFELLSSPLWSFIGPSIFGHPAVHQVPVITPTMVRWRPDCTQPSSPFNNTKNSKLYDVLQWFNDIVLECHTHKLSLCTGDALLINNWSMLHGRNYFDDLDRLLLRARIW